MTEAVVLAFVASVFAVPGVTSIVTSALRRVSDVLGVDPRVIVYAAPIVMTGAILFSAPSPFRPGRATRRCSWLPGSRGPWQTPSSRGHL